AHVQRAIDNILAKFRWDFAMAFIDDIVIYSKMLEDHIGHVDQVLDALAAVGMTLEATKYHFAYDSIKLLGRRVSRFGLSTQEEKVAAIMELPFPTTIKMAQIILGQFNYYRGHIDQYAMIVKPLTDGLKKNKVSPNAQQFMVRKKGNQQPQQSISGNSEQ